MARSRKNTRKSKKGGSTINFANAGKSFKPGEVYGLRWSEFEAKEGEKGDYLEVKFVGVDDGYEDQQMTHRFFAMTSYGLQLLNDYAECAGIEVPEGDVTLDDIGKEFTDTEVLAETFLDKWDGGSRVKIDTFLESDESNLDDEDEDEDKDEDEDENDFDLDDLDEDDVTRLAKAMGIKSRTDSARRKALAKKDDDEVAEAWSDLSEEDEEEDEEEEKPNKKSKKKKKTSKVPASEVEEMNQDDLEDLVDTHNLEVDLDEFRTLKKKRGAVMDALEEEDLLDEDD